MYLCTRTRPDSLALQRKKHATSSTLSHIRVKQKTQFAKVSLKLILPTLADSQIDTDRIGRDTIAHLFVSNPVGPYSSTSFPSEARRLHPAAVGASRPREVEENRQGLELY